MPTRLLHGLCPYVRTEKHTTVHLANCRTAYLKVYPHYIVAESLGGLAEDTTFISHCTITDIHQLLFSPSGHLTEQEEEGMLAFVSTNILPFPPQSTVSCDFPYLQLPVSFHQ